MRYISFFVGERASFGLVRPEGVLDLGARLGSTVPDLKTYLQLEALGFRPPSFGTATDFTHGEFTYAPVIPNPGKIICVGLNYEEHRKETGRPDASAPAIFTRFADSLVGHGMPIRLPPISSTLDYEGELAVVIGKPGFRLAPEHALSIVAGYACFNDATIREWQRHTHQFTPGKNFPGTGAFGPELVTADELPVERLSRCRIETRLNGTVMQSALLGDMIFSIEKIIAYVTGFTPLAPGDVIATGTPGGVGSRRDPPIFMKVGDDVRVTIEGVGQLSNPIAAEAG